ncbi:MAG: hypothetical protein PUP91_32860 [Rhizonema sp. PD37]|nr:hypothetical protein [Rhizonema sp. PD37]
MKTAEKLAAGWLLTLGFMFTTLSFSAVMEKNTMLEPIPPGIEEAPDYPNIDAISTLDNTAINGLILGLPTSVLGIWLTMGLYRRSQQEKKALQEQTSDRLQSTFYRMIQEKNGSITLLSFAMQSQLPPADARKYLDQQAKLFNANFKVSEEGGISYYFDV